MWIMNNMRYKVYINVGVYLLDGSQFHMSGIPHGGKAVGGHSAPPPHCIWRNSAKYFAAAMLW